MSESQGKVISLLPATTQDQPGRRSGLTARDVIDAHFPRRDMVFLAQRAYLTPKLSIYLIDRGRFQKCLVDRAHPVLFTLAPNGNPFVNAFPGAHGDLFFCQPTALKH